MDSTLEWLTKNIYYYICPSCSADAALYRDLHNVIHVLFEHDPSCTELPTTK